MLAKSFLHYASLKAILAPIFKIDLSETTTKTTKSFYVTWLAVKILLEDNNAIAF